MRIIANSSLGFKPKVHVVKPLGYNAKEDDTILGCRNVCVVDKGIPSMDDNPLGIYENNTLLTLVLLKVHITI